MSKPVQYRRQPDHHQQSAYQGPDERIRHPENRRRLAGPRAPEARHDPGGGSAREGRRAPAAPPGGRARRDGRERRDRRHGPGLAGRGPGRPADRGAQPDRPGYPKGAGPGAYPGAVRSAAGRGPAGPGSGHGGGPGTRPRGRSGPRGGPPPQPVALAVAADAADFACLSRYGMFGPATFEAYLRRTEGQLRALRGQGLEVHLRVLEPADFEDFCEEFGLGPEEPAARVAYAADPELAGEPFVYAGERLGELLPVLVEDHRARIRISIACSALLAALEEDERPEPRLTAVLGHVSELYLALAAGAGEGCHLLTLRTYGPEDGEELTAAAEVCAEDGRLFVGGREAEAFCVTLAAGIAADGAGELLLHSVPLAGRPPLVRGWRMAAGRLRPMTVPEVFAALAEDAVRGAGLPEGVAARPGFALPGRPVACDPSRPGAGEPGEAGGAGV
ncbi:hypothetical protein A6A07_24720 [Streptomyces sp. CB03911]|nr:hypothetical protein A6A07_24720 [Streptomyces sp. CB03911]